MNEKKGFTGEPLNITNYNAGSGHSIEPEHNVTGVDGDCDKTPNVEILSEDLHQIWHTTGDSSVDLEDEKVINMTGSYSQILFDGDDKVFPAGSQNIQCLNIDAVQEECGVTTGFVDEAEISTPVYEAVDPTQMFLSEDRINAFMRLSVNNPGQLPSDTYDSSPNQDENLAAGTDDSNFEYTHDDLQSTSEEDSPYHVSNSELQNRLNQAASNVLNSKTPLNAYEGLLSFPQTRAPPIDPTTISDLEAYARNIATSMDTLIENLTGTLHSISALTVDCVETYRDAVCKTCDALDSNIKGMYQLMAKCEELSKSMKPIYHLQEQIKEIRRLLDLFESVVHSGSSK